MKLERESHLNVQDHQKLDSKLIKNRGLPQDLVMIF
jgi:hypothetical protein